MYRIGSSVFNGAFSTFLAVVAMSASQTYIFRVFFRQFFLVTVIGSIHGLIVLPVLLSWFGPNSNVIDHDQATNDDKNKNKDIEFVSKEKETIKSDTERATSAENSANNSKEERTNAIEMEEGKGLTSNEDGYDNINNQNTNEIKPNHNKTATPYQD